MRIAIDTDIGKDVDDILALVYALKHPGIDVALVVTNDEYAKKRASLARQVLNLLGYSKLPVIPGIGLQHPDNFLMGEGLEMASFPRQNLRRLVSSEIKNEGFVYVGIGAMSNLSELGNMPGLAVYQMGARCSPGTKPETNVSLDQRAAESVIATLENLSFVTSDITNDTRLELTHDSELHRKMMERSEKDPVFRLILQNYAAFEAYLEAKCMSGHYHSRMHDPLTVMAACGIRTGTGRAMVDFAIGERRLQGDVLVPGKNMLRYSFAANYEEAMAELTRVVLR